MTSSLVEVFTGKIFERLLHTGTEEDELRDGTPVSFSSNEDDQELRTSVIGPLLWSADYFTNDLSRSSSFDERDERCDGDHLDIKGINNTEAKLLHESQLLHNNVDIGERRKRKTFPIRMTANQVCQELSRPNVSPHLLIAPHIYGESLGAGAGVSQPFEVKVHPQVGFLSDIHGHLCEAEIIGLLADQFWLTQSAFILYGTVDLDIVNCMIHSADPGPIHASKKGKWDASMKCLYVQAAFPCTSTEREDDDGSTDVELDPVAELTVRDMISDLGLIVVGWYHSHPKFQPDPSVTDINNQQQYQNLMKDEISGIEPFVGLIVSTYDLKLTSLKSHHQWFHTKLYSDGTRGKKPFFIPMLLKTTEGIFCDRYHDIDAFSNDTQTKKLIKKLLELDPESTIIQNENEVNLSQSGSYEAKIKRKFYVDKKGNNSDDYMTDVRYSSVSNNKLNYGREGLQKNMKEEKGKRNYRKINGNDDVCSVKNDKTNNKNTYYSDDYNSDNNNDNHDANSDSHNDGSNTNNNYYHHDNSDSHNDGSNTNNNDYHDDNSDSHNDGSNTNNNYYPYDDNYDIEEENISEPLIFKISKKNIINNEIEQMWIMGGTQVKEDEVDVERSIQEEEGGGKEEDEEEKKEENEGRDEEINKDKEEIRNEEINLESINPLEHDFGGDNCQYIFGIKVPCSSKTSSMSIQSTREKVPMNFKAAGSSGYLGDDMIWPDPEGGRSDINHIDNNNNVNNGNDNDINHSKEINDINTLGNIDMIHHGGNDNNNKTESTSDVQGRRKYKKRINDDTYVERRSGREIKSRDLYVPEKEKILNPSVAATSTSTSVLTDKKVAETSIGSKSPSIVPINNSLNWNSKMKVNNVKMKLLDDDDNDQKQPLGRKKQKISGMIINPISHPISSKADKGNKFNNSYETISSSSSNNSSNLVSKMKHNGTVDKWLTAGSVAVAVKEHGPESSKNISSKKNKMEPVKRNLKKILSDDFSSQSESNSFSSLFPPCNESNDNLPIKIDKRSKEYKLLVVKNLKFLKKSTNVSSMTDTAETVPSQLTKSNEREFLKNRKKGILSNIRVGTYSSDTEKEYFQDDNIEKIEKEEEKEITESNTFLSLLQKLQSSNSSSIKGRELICSIKPNFRFLLLGIVSLGFYYANHPRRIDLNKVWKHDIIRSEKLKGSIRVWACKLYMSDSSTEKLISDIIDFLLSCWLDNDEKELKKPKNEIKKKKRKATTCSHGDNNCTSIHSHSHHIPLKQKFMIYKEDRGEIKVTKKKKKKKVLKKI